MEVVMKARQPFFLLLLCLLLVSLLCSCGQSDVQQEAPPVADSDGEEIMYSEILGSQPPRGFRKKPQETSLSALTVISTM